MTPPARVLALCGGVGGAKLALGLSHILSEGDLTVVVNTADDFDHLGLRICPDLDTVTYTLAAIVNPHTGWGRAEETGNFMAALSALGGEEWFYLGDKDLAVHVERTRRLKVGEQLDAVTQGIARKLGIAVQILPMSNDPVATMVATDAGALAFQHYFVRERCQPRVTGFHFTGIAAATPHPELMDALAGDDLAAVIICPSNPFVSIDPILALPGVREALRTTSAPVIAVSPVVGGAAVKGPTAKIMAELGLEVSARAVAERYVDILDGFVVDRQDAALVDQIARTVDRVKVAQTIMVTLQDRVSLAREVLLFAKRCSAKARGNPVLS